jgi:hypothetical protein
LAFEFFVKTEIEGTLPNGGRNKALLRVASIASFLVMKGMSPHDRLTPTGGIWLAEYTGEAALSRSWKSGEGSTTGRTDEGHRVGVDFRKCTFGDP